MCLFPYLLADQFDIVLLLQDRIEIIEANITDRPDVVVSADVIIMNNVFEFFLEPEEQISVWRFLRQTTKRGTLLVTEPPLEETFSHLQVSINVSLWVSISLSLQVSISVSLQVSIS
jgi:chemotaxis methyl-accepting protein methylase